MTALLVIDVGTTGLRAAVVDDDVDDPCALDYRPCPPSTPFPGLVEFDAAEMAAKRARGRGHRARPGRRAGRRRRHHQPARLARSCGTAPRASRSGRHSAGRTCARSATASTAKAEHGWAIAPNQSVTKVAWLLANSGDLDRPGPLLRHGRHLDRVDAVGRRASLHVTDQSNARPSRRRCGASTASDWNDDVLDAFARPADRCCPIVVDSTGVFGEASALPGARRSPASLGDQQASLVGQGCVRPRPGQDHVRHRRHARPLHGRRHARRHQPDAAARHLPARRCGRAAAISRGASRRSCCRQARTSSGCATTSASSPRATESHDVASACDDDRRRGVRAGAARPRHAALGLRGARHAARHHAGHRAAPRRAGRARGHRPSRRRPARGGRGRHRRRHLGGAHRRRDERRTRRSCRRSPTPRAARSRSRRRRSRPRSAPPSSPGSASACSAAWTISTSCGARPRRRARRRPIGTRARDRWRTAVERTARLDSRPVGARLLSRGGLRATPPPRVVRMLRQGQGCREHEPERTHPRGPRNR